MRLSRILFLQSKLSFTDILRNNFRRAVQDPRYLKTVDTISSKIDATGVKDSLYRNIISINQWYTRILGLDEVKQFQDRVILLQSKLSFTDILRNNFRRAVQDPRYLKTVDTISSKIDATGVKDSLYRNIISINQWYTRILGLDEVKQFQDRVILLQEKLLVTQEKRREIGSQLSEIRKKSYQLQDELQTIKRQEEPDKYFKLMKEETELLKLEHEVNLSFQEYDKAERDLFSAYSNAVRDSHEKYRSQMDYTKYFGIILSIAGSFLAFAYTTLRKHDLKMFIDKKLENLYGSLDSTIIQSVAKEQSEISSKLGGLQEENRKLLSSLESISFQHSQDSKNVEALPLVVQDSQDGFDDNRTKLIIGFSFCLIFIGYVLGKIDR